MIVSTGPFLQVTSSTHQSFDPHQIPLGSTSALEKIAESTGSCNHYVWFCAEVLGLLHHIHTSDNGDGG